MNLFQNDHWSRRQFLRCGALGAAGLLLVESLRLPAWAQPLSPAPAPAPGTAAASIKPKAKSVIQIWLWGGPAHIDTFDPKPDAGSDYTGPFTKPISTNVPGIAINEMLPLLAKQADKYSLIRSMTHGNNGHETAAYLVQTGRPPGTGLVYPSMGAVVSLFKGYDGGYKGKIPPYIVLTELQGRFSEAGFLNSRYKPFATGGDPGQTRFTVEGVVAANITQERQRARRDLLGNLNSLAQAMPGDRELAAAAQAQADAYDLILGDGGKIFDLNQESAEMRENYGRNTFGQSCLMARRLVEQGVPYITINAKGWDTHKSHFQAMRQKLPQVDKALAALLQDLASRGLLDQTIVWVSGEFGRTPKVQWEAPWQGGRSHYGKVFSALIAGGGFKGGQVLGSSDAKGEDVKDRPVYPIDLIGSMYTLMGIDLNATLPHPQGKEAFVMPRPGDNVKSAGLITELM